ncbi:HAD family hydrolase [Bacillus cereus]|uniref:D-glycero-alpha-D-manno-heptose-1,7-bisphosphate 7-phosphatase n=1 Tax=Bacillus cereus TaxID=1396 RepID=UPI0030FF024D
MDNKKNETVSCECKSCESDFLAITGTKEFELKICYRCFMNGMAESYLAGQKRVMNKAVFLDRDGILNEVLSTRVKFVNKPEDLYLLPGVAESIAKLKRNGFKVFTVTNQGGIGLGYMSYEQLEKIHEKLQSEILKLNELAVIDEIMTCAHKPKENCKCRKPEPGMLLTLAKKHNISLGDSYMVGDREVDVAAGISAGTKTVLVTNEDEPTQANLKCSTLLEAVDYILEDSKEEQK